MAGQIGLGWDLAVNDGVADAFADILYIVDMDTPDEGAFGMVESKRLDLSGKQVERIPTVKTPGDWTFTYEFDKTQYARLAALKGVAKNWKVSSTDGVAWTRTVPGVLLGQQVGRVTADGIVPVTVTVGASGAAS